VADSTIKIALKLLVITLIAGLALGLTNAITAGPIAEQAALSAENARKEVLSADSFYEVPLDELKADAAWQSGYDAVTAVYGAKGADGSFMGSVIEVNGKGYGGTIGITVGVDVDLKITGIKIGSHSETPGLGAKTTDVKFYGQFAGLDAKEDIAVGSEITAISGATVSSKGVTTAVDAAASLAVDFAKTIEEAMK